MALLGLLLAAGCAAAAETEKTYVQADVVFNQEMITHHQQTIQLAEAADGRAGSSYVRELAGKLIPEERADIAMMESWLRSWNEAVPVKAAAGTGKDLPEGDGFDRAWLTALSEHLHHGVMMAETVRKSGRHGPTLELAEKIIEVQNAELKEITGRLT
uniref:Putative lipoprotein n=1 Tax=Nonomuraea gerenzanensis TaxID=93944 RepID=A0A1M4EGJ1_9ACTN|nr:putative lipoprotein [Nonomuraea gerenzanensis]